MNDGPQLRLPTGMRDFAPRAAASRRRIAETLLGVFERWGFARVITPAFEYEDVLAQGLGGAGLEPPTIDLGHLGLAREVLSALALPEPELEEARRRIAKRDTSGLE